MTENKKLSQQFHLEGVYGPALFVFVGHGYLQYAGCGRRGSHGLCYHAYFISADYNLKIRCLFPMTRNFQYAEILQQNYIKGKLNARGAYKNDKSGKCESKTKGSAAGRTDSKKAPDWKITAASISKDKFIVTLSTCLE